MSNLLQTLAEGVVNRNLIKEGVALVEKWQKTGLLEGITDEYQVKSMSLLLENQVKELLREASTMEAGNVEGFAAVAFPIVRRVFGGLIANDLVSVQPMSLPAGLIFFLDFEFTGSRLTGGAYANQSIYGQGVRGKEIIDGVNISGEPGTGYDSTSDLWQLEKGFYSLNNSYAHATHSASVTPIGVVTGTVGDGQSGTAGTVTIVIDEAVEYDPELMGYEVAIALYTASAFPQLDLKNLSTLYTNLSTGSLVRRHATYIRPAAGEEYVAVCATAGDGTDISTNISSSFVESNTFYFAVGDNFTAGGGLGSIKGTTLWPLENETDIPEIDIRIDSVAVTAMTKKMKAKWTPELGQDLNAYHNLDAEVELTSILSEQIALEIDQEILQDLVKGATAGVYYWSRRPGRFVNRTTGELLNILEQGDFTGTVSAWYETALETVNDISAQIHRKTLRGAANFIVCGPEVANILEFTNGFKASVTGDEVKGTAGIYKSGSISKKWDLYVDPYFPRNVCLVGRKGSSFLESGYVYCPYVPLQTTPTIFDPESFVPRKGCMTRYAKKMVRPDMYGILVIRDLLG